MRNMTRILSFEVHEESADWQEKAPKQACASEVHIIVPKSVELHCSYEGTVSFNT